MKMWQTKNGYQVVKLLSGRSNVFLLSTGSKNILVDTSHSGKWSDLKNALRSQNISRIDLLVLTHTHYDHAGNAAKIKKEYDAQLIVHQSEQFFIQNGKNQFPQGTNVFSKTLIRQLGDRISKKFDFESCEADILIDDRFDLNPLGFNAYLIHTPGHTSGSISLIVDNEIAIVGDAMFGVFPNSVFPPFADDINELVTSWGKLIETGCALFLPSHGFERTAVTVTRQFRKRKL